MKENGILFELPGGFRVMRVRDNVVPLCTCLGLLGSSGKELVIGIQRFLWVWWVIYGYAKVFMSMYMCQLLVCMGVCGCTTLVMGKQGFFFNPSTPKIWLLVLPSSCYTFPRKLVLRIWCKIEAKKFYLIGLDILITAEKCTDISGRSCVLISLGS